MQLYPPGKTQHFSQPRVSWPAAVNNVQVHGQQANTGMLAGFFVFNIHFQLQEVFLAAAEHGQRPVGWNPGHNIFVGKVVAEFLCGLLLPLNNIGHQQRFILEEFAQLGEQFSIFRKTLHQYLPSTVEHTFGVIEGIFIVCVGIDKRGSFAHRVEQGVAQQHVSQWFNTGLDGYLGAGAALLFVGQVQIFEAVFGIRGVNQISQFRGQFPLLINGRKNALAALFKFPEITKAFFEVSHLGIVQGAGDLFAIAGYKRHCRPFIQQAYGSDHLFCLDAKFFGNAYGNIDH